MILKIPYEKLVCDFEVATLNSPIVMAINDLLEESGVKYKKLRFSDVHFLSQFKKVSYTFNPQDNHIEVELIYE